MFSFSGHVITMECFEKLIKKDWLHPLTGEKLTEKDLIPLQRVRSKYCLNMLFLFYYYLTYQGGTGYATTNINLEGKNARPVLQA